MSHMRNVSGPSDRLLCLTHRERSAIPWGRVDIEELTTPMTPSHRGEWSAQEVSRKHVIWMIRMCKATCQGSTKTRVYAGQWYRRLLCTALGYILHNIHSSISILYKASGEMSPRVLRSAALYALRSECVSSPYSDCASMCS